MHNYILVNDTLAKSVAILTKDKDLQRNIACTRAQLLQTSKETSARRTHTPSVLPICAWNKHKESTNTSVEFYFDR